MELYVNVKQAIIMIMMFAKYVSLVVYNVIMELYAKNVMNNKTLYWIRVFVFVKMILILKKTVNASYAIN
jgi:hypothetical protein